MKKIIIITIFISTFLFAKDFTFESKENRVNIIELYTSQGCSSCPPADKWLSKLKNHPKVFKEFIPMAFHVTYWDFIGWKDKFATKLNDNRQRYYANKVWGNNSVYTPQFIINSKEYKKWFTNRSFPSLKKTYGGKLTINLKNSRLEVDYYNRNLQNDKLYLNIGILGFNHEVNIKSGENKYKTLKHDFVMLNHIQKFAKMDDNKLKLKTNLFHLKKDDNPQAIVVWISSYDSEIIQATGGYIQ